MILGRDIFEAFKDQPSLGLAVNARIVPGVVRGVLRAAKDLNSLVFFELAQSEGDLSGGYTGLTPRIFSEKIQEVAQEVGFEHFALHADHVKIRSKKSEVRIKKLIKAQVEAGFSSFCLDGSALPLEKNAALTAGMAKFVRNQMKDAALEVEVSQIGGELTEPEEALEFLELLKEEGIEPEGLAIANGTKHGDFEGEGIDLEQTKKVGETIKEAGFKTRLVQHGTTGVPLEILEKLPQEYMVKANVGTLWMEIVFSVLKKEKPELWGKIQKFKPPKLGIKECFYSFENLEKEIKKKIEDRCYKEAKKLIKVFGSQGTVDKQGSV